MDPPTADRSTFSFFVWGSTEDFFLSSTTSQAGRRMLMFLSILPLAHHPCDGCRTGTCKQVQNAGVWGAGYWVRRCRHAFMYERRESPWGYLVYAVGVVCAACLISCVAFLKTSSLCPRHTLLSDVPVLRHSSGRMLLWHRAGPVEQKQGYVYYMFDRSICDVIPLRAVARLFAFCGIRVRTLKWRTASTIPLQGDGLPFLTLSVEPADYYVAAYAKLDEKRARLAQIEGFRVQRIASGVHADHLGPAPALESAHFLIFCLVRVVCRCSVLSTRSPT